MGKRMQVCVIGLGQFGRELAIRLAATCDVVALDTDADAVNDIADKVQTARILDACEHASLARVVDENFDEAIVAIGDSLESSVLATLHLKQIGVKRISAKAINRDHAEILRSIGATSVVFPEVDSAKHVAAQILHPNLLDYVPLARGYQVMTIEIPDTFVGHSLRTLNLRARAGLFVLAIQDETGTAVRFLPSPDETLGEGDQLVVIGHEDDLGKIDRLPEVGTRVVRPDADGEASPGGPA